jgi:hypothetical protein
MLTTSATLLPLSTPERMADELLDRARHADRMGWTRTRDHHLRRAAGHYRAAGREDLARTCERLIGRP